MFVVALVLGAVLLPTSIWMYRGRSKRSRFWLDQDGFIDERMVVLFFPSVTMFLLGMGTAQLWSLMISKAHPVPLWILTTISFAFAAVGIVGSLWGLFGFKYPQWVRPQWLRDLDEYNAKKSKGKKNQ